MNLAYDELVDFLVATTAPRAIIDFRASDAAKEKVADLIRRQKTGPLSPEDESELRHCLAAEHLVRLAKARARERLAAA